MGILGPARKRGILALSALVIGALVASAAAAGPGGWDHLGDGAHYGATRSTSSPPHWR